MFTQLLRRIRQNHSLEHATINLLSQRYPQAQIIGLSGPWGFTLYTTLTVEEVVPTAMQALKRLQAGEHHLRLHPHCGTNLVITAAMTAMAGGVGLAGRQKDRPPLLHWLERLPTLLLLNSLALTAARPLAAWVQAHLTTEQDMSGVEITSVFTGGQGRGGQLRRIRVHTRQVG